MENFNFDHEFDVVVIGTGNGGLTSAICARDGGQVSLLLRSQINMVAQVQHLEEEFGYPIIGMQLQRMLMILMMMLKHTSTVFLPMA